MIVNNPFVNFDFKDENPEKAEDAKITLNRIDPEKG